MRQLERCGDSRRGAGAIPGSTADAGEVPARCRQFERRGRFPLPATLCVTRRIDGRRTHCRRSSGSLRSRPISLRSRRVAAPARLPTRQAGRRDIISPRRPRLMRSVSCTPAPGARGAAAAWVPQQRAHHPSQRNQQSTRNRRDAWQRQKRAHVSSRGAAWRAGGLAGS